MGMVYATKKGEMNNPSPEVQKAADSMKKSDAKDFASTKHKGLPNKVVQKEESNPRIPRKKGQPAGSKKHSDLYTDENPKGTIHGLGFKDVATAKASVSKIRNSSRSHAHKIQAAVAMEQRAREMGKTSEAAVYRKFINTMKEKTKKMNEAINPAQQAAIAISKKNRLQDLKIAKKKKKSMSEKKDHEHSMIRSQLSTIMRASQRLKKKMKGEGDVEAWVQSKITKAADYIDTAADYVDSGEVNEEGLRDWFGKSSGTTKSGRKVKGWVQVGGKYDGKPCARQPGQKTTPKCTSSSKRASMSDKERDSARRRKVAKDPNQPQKSGAAAPTMVSTDPKKKMKEAYGGQGVSRKAKLASTHPPTAQAAIKNIPTETDRGSGNKAARRAGMEVKTKNPTLQAYLKNKKKISERHYGSSVNKIPAELDKAVALHKSQAKRLRDSDEVKKDAGKAANKIPAQLDKAVAMHTKQAKTLRAAGVGEGFKGYADLSKSHPEAVKKMEDHIAKHFGKKNPRVTGGKMGVKKEEFVNEAKVDQGKDDASKINTRNQRAFGNRRDSKGGGHTGDDMEARRYNTEKGRGVKMRGKKDKTPINYKKRDSDKAIDEILGRKPKKEPTYLQKKARTVEIKRKIKNKEGKFAEEVELVNEADKKGKGSGTKDACYHKVKSRYSVWPSAYASGALVKCRKVGAANWGNSRKEEFERDGISFGQFQEKCWPGYEKKGMKTMFGKRYPNCVKKKASKEEVEHVYEDDMKGMSVKSGHKRPTKSGAGMTAKGVAAYRRRNPGSKLKTAVTTKPSKLKKGSKAANRRKSFCKRMTGMKKKLNSAKTARDPDSRINKALRRWNC